MALNMKSLTQTLAKTAALIEKHVQSTVQEVTGPKGLQDYELVDQIGSAGPGLAWKLYHGRPRNKAEHAHNPVVCVWFLDKKVLSETRQRIGLTKAAEDAFLDVLRADAAQLLKLRHPGVIRVIQALDENKNAMAMVTEPIFASIANVLGDMDNVPKIPKDLKGLELGSLEIKHGLLQLAESLSFLHNNAQLVHRAISPEAVFITSSGSWKFGGFGFATSVEQAMSDGRTGASFHYPEYDVDEVLMPLQPQLNYTAPELTHGGGSPGPCSDIFSLGCLAYHLLSRESLIQCKGNLKAYKNKMQYLTSGSFSKIPFELVHGLQSMLSVHELSRPTASDFTGSPFFREDTRLRALRFLDHMLERDNLQKTDFLKALSNMWTDFDVRVLRYKVLPPLCLELRNVIMLPMVLPMVLTIAESQDRADFETSTLPSLLPVLSSATGDSLLLLIKHAALLINKVGSEQLTTSVVPMLVRAYDDPDARMQEEVLKRTLAIAKQIDYQVLKQSILPRIHGLALKTTVAAVRVNALLCLSEFVQRLDKQAIKEVLQTLERCTAVDHSAATLMCTLGVTSAIYKQFGVEFAAQHILPLLTPLLVAQQLNNQQFAKYMNLVKEIMREIEEKRGFKNGETPVPTPDVTKAGSLNGSITQSQTKPSWDDWSMNHKAASDNRSPEASVLSTEDWASSVVMSTKPTGSSTKPTGVEDWASSVMSTKPISVDNSIVTQAASSFDWQAASTNTTTSLDGQISVSTASSYGESFDPFADWPPRTSSGATAYGVAANASTNSSTKSQVDLTSIFSNNQESKQPSMRLAPPPPTSSSGLAKGRGRTPMRPIGSPGTKGVPAKKQQPPMLDLLQ